MYVVIIGNLVRVYGPFPTRAAAEAYQPAELDTLTRDIAALLNACGIDGSRVAMVRHG